MEDVKIKLYTAFLNGIASLLYSQPVPNKEKEVAVTSKLAELTNNFKRDMWLIASDEVIVAALETMSPNRNPLKSFSKLAVAMRKDIRNSRLNEETFLMTIIKASDWNSIHTLLK